MSVEGTNETMTGSSKKIGIVYGMENTFPSALVDCINGRQVPGVTAEHLRIGAVRMAEPSGYSVIIDRISHDIPFYRAYLKNAVLGGTIVINNPFWWGADDKFFNYALASKIGVAVAAHGDPAAQIEPARNHRAIHAQPDLSARLGRRVRLHRLSRVSKPFSGGGWKSVYRVDNRDDFFHAYDQTGDLCMTLQQGIEFREYFRCYVVDQKRVRIMQYDPRLPHAQRYVRNPAPVEPALLERVENDARTLCVALGYDFNTVEFAVQDGIPYAIDFLNPAPDADFHSVGEENFKWVVNAVADMAIEKAVSGENPASEMRWSSFLAPLTKTLTA